MGLRGRTTATELMFYGEYEHTLDDKNRLTLPARFRDAFATGVVLAKGIERNIDVFPRESWDASVSRIASLDSLSSEGRSMKRHVFSGATITELDKQGRVIVPVALAERAGIDRDVVVAGVYDHIEVWDREAWAAQVDAMEGSAGDVAERLADRRS